MKACGKAILFGEHAVVYGSAGIGVPLLEYCINVMISKSDELSYNVDRILNKEKLKKLEELIRFLSKKLNFIYHAQIESELPISSGFGSSAAISVALIKSINQKLESKLNLKEINKLAYECEKIFHGTPSGIDNTVVTYARPVFFKSGKFEIIEPKSFGIVIANTGIKPPTKEVVQSVRELYENNKEKVQKIFNEIESITKKAKESMINGEIIELGNLMNKNHKLLQKLNVSSPKLDLFCEIALNNGAYGAKLSGAGRGGNMIALVDEKTKDKVISELEHLSNQVYYTEIK